MRILPDGSAVQLPPAQQSVAFLHSSPSERQRGIIILGAGMSPHRLTPGGPTLQLPEQHSPSQPHRS